MASGIDIEEALERTLAGLNPAQREAVETLDGPLLIFAGAGSGKTKVLTTRVANLIAQRKVWPDRLLAVTFTNKAAREMRERVAQLVGTSDRMWVGTFHATAVRMLRRDAERVGLSSSFTIFDEDDSRAALRRVLNDLRLDPKRYPPATISAAISKAKNELLTPETYPDRSYQDEVVRRCFARYQELLLRSDGVDFDDLIGKTVQLLQEDEDALERWRDRFRYVLVDEYQDTNRAQYVLVNIQAAEHRQIAVVGDDDQCLVAGTRVRMADGSDRPIEDVRAGDRVLASHGSGDVRPAKVLRAHRSAAPRIGVAITTRSGRRIVSTPEHVHFAGEPLRTPGATTGRPQVELTLCGASAGRHELALAGQAPDRHVISAHYGELSAALDRIRDGVAVDVVQMADLGRGASLPFIRAGAVRPGMSMFDAAGGYDVVEKVESVPLEGYVHDLDVEHVHNFVAEGLLTHNSIYRWRGADVRNILSFESDYPEAKVVRLEQNYRSTQAILDAAYHVIRRNPERAEKRLWTNRAGGDLLQAVQLYNEVEEAEFVADEVERLRRQGRSYAEFAVLYRTNAQSRAFEDVFRRRRVPYRLVGGVRFWERAEIKDLLAYLRFLANPNDAVSFSRLVNVPRRKIGGVSVDALIQHAEAGGIDLLQTIRDPDRVQGLPKAARGPVRNLYEQIESVRATMGALQPSELVEHLMAVMGLKDHYQDGTPQGDARIENLREVQGLAQEFDQQGDAGQALQQFLTDVALVSDVDTYDEAGEGVTLITLHMVKGLEFPIVFLVGVEEGLLPHRRAVEDERELPEERRLAYVGITRAKDRLYLTCAFRRHLYGQAQAGFPSRFLGDVPASLVAPPRKGAAPAAPPRDGRRGIGAGRMNEAARRQMMERQVESRPVEPPVQRFAAGDRVTHPSFGTGTVLKSTLTRTDEELVVQFQRVGVKILSASLAPLQKG